MSAEPLIESDLTDEDRELLVREAMWRAAGSSLALRLRDQAGTSLAARLGHLNEDEEPV